MPRSEDERSSKSTKKSRKDKKEKKDKLHERDDDRDPRKDKHKGKRKDDVQSPVREEFNDQGSDAPKPFIWRKKIERMAEEGKGVQVLTQAVFREKQAANQAELEDIKRRRAEREEKKRSEELFREQLQRSLDQETNLGWEDKEEDFHRRQALIRTEIRLREGREKAIDILVKNLHVLQKLDDPKSLLALGSAIGQSEAEMKAREDFLSSLEVDLQEPYSVFDSLSYLDLKDLKSEIDNQKSLGAFVDIYWQPLGVLCERELDVAEVRRKSRNSLSTREAAQIVKRGVSSLPSGVIDDIDTMFVMRSAKSLDALAADVKSRIDSARAAVLRSALGAEGSEPAADMGYWEVVLHELKIHKARAQLVQFHKRLLKKRLRQLQVDSQTPSDSGETERAGAAVLTIPTDQDKADDDRATTSAEAVNVVVVEARPETPTPFPFSILGTLGEDAISPEEDEAQLAAQRDAVMEQRISADVDRDLAQKDGGSGAAASELSAIPSRFAPDDSTGPGDVALYQAEAARKLQPDEEFFGDGDVGVAARNYSWQDKYRPRKPKYFNKVKTGFDWNKYNRTHYDRDNPPPKVVHGYRFNIFYPDLVDPSKPPTYRVEKDPDGNPDFCVLRFSAGPPYEDVAFKIINKKWNIQPRHGFKCTFMKGVLCLWFSFLRVFYRR